MSRLLNEVKVTFDLEKLVRQFTLLCRDKSYQVVNFYETGKTSLPRKSNSLATSLICPRKTGKDLEALAILAPSLIPYPVGIRELLMLTSWLTGLP